MRFVKMATKVAENVRPTKVAKFVTVTMPLSMFGWHLNKSIFLWGRSLWAHSVNPTCPDCDTGILLVQHDAHPTLDQRDGVPDSRPLQPWVCNHCGFGMLAPTTSQGIREVANNHRLARARVLFGELSMAERQEFGRKHRIASRIFFVAATLIAANGIYLFATAAPFIVALNWLSFAFMFWVFGMKRSYRAWQVVTGHIFQEGAAKHWFDHEKWLV